MDGHDCEPQAFGGGNRSGPDRAAATLVAKGHKCDFEVETFVAHSLRADGFDAGEDGTGRRTPIVPVAFAENSRAEIRLCGGDGSVAAQLTTGGGKPGQGAPCIAFICKDHGADADAAVSATLRGMGHDGSHANGGGQVAVAFPTEMSATQYASAENISPALSVKHTTAVAARWGVRRLMPVECERLQAFPDNWTRIEWRGKPADQCPDGPRYKGCGNSMAGNVMAWLGERIDAVEAVAQQRAAA